MPGLRKNDPIPALAAHMREAGALDDQQDAAVKARAHQRVEEAYAFARASAYPDPSEMLQHVFVAA